MKKKRKRCPGPGRFWKRRLSAPPELPGSGKSGAHVTLPRRGNARPERRRAAAPRGRGGGGAWRDLQARSRKEAEHRYAEARGGNDAETREGDRRGEGNPGRRGERAHGHARARGADHRAPGHRGLSVRATTCSCRTTSSPRRKPSGAAGTRPTTMSATSRRGSPSAATASATTRASCPPRKGITYREADCYYTRGRRNGHRVVFSSEGRVWYTGDHYTTFQELFPSGGGE